MYFKKIKSDTYDYDYFRNCEKSFKPYITINDKDKYADIIVDCDTFGAEIYDKVQGYINENYNALYGDIEPFVRLHQKIDGFIFRLGCFNRLLVECEFAEEIAIKLYDVLMDIIYNKLKLKFEANYLNEKDKKAMEQTLEFYRFMEARTKVIDIDIDLLDHGHKCEDIPSKEELLQKKENILETKKKLDDLMQKLDDKSRKFIEMKYLKGVKHRNILKELKLSPLTAKEFKEQIYIKVYNHLFNT